MNSEIEILEERRYNVSALKHAVIFPTIFLYFIGEELLNYVINEWLQYKMKMNIFPGLTENTANFSACVIKNHSDLNYVKYTAVEQETSDWILYYKLAYLIPSFFVLLFITSYSDMFGRKFIFNISASLSLIKSIIIAITIYTDQSPMFIVLAHVLYGLTGSSYSILSVSFSSIADIAIDKSQCVRKIVVLDTMTILSKLCAAIASGYFLDTLQLGYTHTAYICVAVIFVAYIITMTLVPETLPTNRRAPKKSFWQTLHRTVAFYTNKEFKTDHVMYILLIMSFLVGQIAVINQEALEGIYFKEPPFCWKKQKMKYFAFVHSAGKGLIGLGSIKLLQISFSNEAIAVISAISAIAGYVIETLAKSDIIVYMVPIGGVFSLLIFTMIRGIMSNMTPADRQGSIFASIAATAVLGTIIGVTVSDSIYTAILCYMDNFVIWFMVIGVFFVAEFVLILTTYCIKPRTGSIDVIVLSNEGLT